jgi:hypothetical protein
MRYRATILLLLALLLGAPPYLQWRSQQSLCIQNQGGLPDTTTFTGLLGGGPDPQYRCGDVAPPTSGMQALSVLSLCCLGGFLFFTVQGVAARRREQAFLRAAGVNVPEDELPLEE